MRRRKRKRRERETHRRHRRHCRHCLVFGATLRRDVRAIAYGSALAGWRAPSAGQYTQHPRPGERLVAVRQLRSRFEISIVFYAMPLIANNNNNSKTVNKKNCYRGQGPFVSLSLLLLSTAGCLCNPDAKRLYDDLLSNYNRLIRPVSNNTDTVLVKLGLRLSQLIELVRTITRLIIRDIPNEINRKYSVSNIIVAPAP